MTVESEELARALAAAPWWPEAAMKHGRGAVVVYPDFDPAPMTVTLVWGSGGEFFAMLNAFHTFHGGAPVARCIPDLAAPSTQGCLWAMLREATNHLVRIETGGGEELGAYVERLQRLNDAADTIETQTESGVVGEALARTLLAARGGT